MERGTALMVAGAIVAPNAVLFAAFRSGLNLRFRDPSLTKPQLFLAMALLMFAIYHLDDGRGLALVLCFVVFLFPWFGIVGGKISAMRWRRRSAAGARSRCSSSTPTASS